ncbi:alpha/beta-hydrolase [Ramaria rubella]|nr:alpha/beta-hydrolase [Ramaria rubella]
MTCQQPERFHIAIHEDHLRLLQDKLSVTTLPDELDEAGWDYGVPLADVRELVAYWKNGFNWKEQEARLNANLPQFTLDIPVDGFETLNIHFVHQRSAVTHAIPLLFIHGWPGSFLEVSKVLPLLSTPAKGQPSFHVVAISLPAYGFSQGTKKKGFGLAQYAEIGNKLMLSLGYNKYVTQGGDWGFRITRMIGSMYGGTHCLGSHINMPMGFKPRFFTNPLLWLHHALTPYSREEKLGFEREERFQRLGAGYRAIQGTRPQTLGYSLADSPVGLLAWIYEKLREWTDDYPWTKDEILTWVSIYVFSRDGPAASLRIYYEVIRQGQRELAIHPMSKVPLGISFFPKEIYHPPRDFARTLGNVVFESVHQSGGHFAAYEKPQLIANDLRAMFGKNGPAFGMVPGNNGYDRKTKTRL